MSNSIKIFALKEDDIVRTVFASSRFEGGLSTEFDPETGQFKYRVFIHSRFPIKEVASWEFLSFEKARAFAAQHFSKGWEILSWDFKTRRPCEEGGRECGSGECDTCRSLAKEVANDPSAQKGCGGCGHAH